MGMRQRLVELVIAAAAIVFAVMAVSLAGESPLGGASLLRFYLRGILSPLRMLTAWLVVFYLISFYLSLPQLFPLPAIFRKTVGLPPLLTPAELLDYGRRFLVRLRRTLSIIIPGVLALVSLSLALDAMNAWNASRLRDELLLGLDRLLTASYPFIELTAIPYPPWFISAVIVSFHYLVPAIFMLPAYLSQRHYPLFRQFAAAFFVSTLLSFPGWLLTPALSPHDRFIDNVYQRSLSSEIAAALDRYKPSPAVARFLADVRQSKDRELGGVMPTSTMPSAHVAWAVLLVYYGWRALPLISLLTIPLAILSTLGTVLLAQHYAIDIPAGVVVALLGIAIARRIALLEHRAASAAGSRV